MFKRILRKLKPGVYKTTLDLKTSTNLLHQSIDRLENIANGLTKVDDRLTKIRELVSRVEPYQPLYGITGIIDEPKRSSKDRCNSILNSLGKDITGLRVLDVGSSLGYTSFYMADRGAVVQAWESNVNNAEVAKHVRGVNGVPVDLLVKELNIDTAKTIKTNQFDVVIVLSVFHHLIHEQGLESTKKIVGELLQKAPILIVELAKKGEDPKLWWDTAQPDDELEIIEGLDVEVEKIGDFGNHLSNKTRPIYKITKKHVIVNNKAYPYNRLSHVPYKDSPITSSVLQRIYYYSSQHFIKHYVFNRDIKDNQQQIINEINFYQNLTRNNKSHPLLTKMTDFEISGGCAKIVFEKFDGALPDENWSKLDELGLEKVVIDLLNVLSFVEGLGYHHNDIRSWNIMLGKKDSRLIDFGLTSPIEIEDNKKALLWAVWALANRSRETYEAKDDKMGLPPETSFKTSFLSKLYGLLLDEKVSFRSVLKDLRK